MSRAEWERLGTVYHTELDPHTGRMRTLNGRGEIMESIVSKACLLYTSPSPRD